MHSCLLRSWLVILVVGSCLGQPPTQKKKVRSESDLPRYTYLVKGTVADLLQSSPGTFGVFAAEVHTDLQALLDNYDIEDKSTERTLLEAKLSLEELNGENEAALDTIKTIRGLEEKPDARLMHDAVDEAILQARLDSHSAAGSGYEQAFSHRFAAAINELPWSVVQESVKQMKGTYQVLSASFITGAANSNLQQMVDKSGSVDNQAAWLLLSMRRALLYAIPLKSEIVGIVQPYITAHTVEKPDIWQSREVTLTAAQELHPVLIGIWDSGVDTSVFPTQLYVDPDPGWHDPHGLAFDDQGGHSRSLLLPLTAAQQQEYQGFVAILKGLEDQKSGVDTPEASAFRQKMASAQPDQVRSMIDKLKVYDPYIHGTHVAGIAVRGDPAARLVVFRFNDQLPDLTFAPTPEWAHRMADNFRQIGEYCRTHHVQVVNMSWGDEPGEFETWLSKTGKGQDAAARKEEAIQLFQIWKAGISDAIQSAPGTLFICAAGNSNSNPGFIEDVPPSLHLPNLIAVGAVDQAGDETSFTSHGATVVVDADGYNVESYVPGGTRMKLSGTSMASPNVTNLAAKLFALDPSLSPEQVISLIKEGATTSDDGRRHLIEEKRSVELLHKLAQR
jgi:hypothetical protein